MRTYLTPIRGDSEFEHCSTALPYHRSPIPFGSVLYTSKKTSVRFSRLRAEPTRSSAVSCIHAHRLHRVDGHCTLNKAAGVNCTGFNERRSAHPSIRPLEWRPLSTVFNRRRFLNYWEHFSWNRPPTRGVPWNLLNEPTSGNFSYRKDSVCPYTRTFLVHCHRFYHEGPAKLMG